jgi:PAS domain S-box-containing protein
MSSPHLSQDLLSLEQMIERAPITVSADALLSQVIALMSQVQGSNCTLPEPGKSPRLDWIAQRSSCVLVMAESQLVGMLTERDIVKLSAYGARLSGLRVAEVMSRNVITVSLADAQAAQNAFRLFSQQKIRYLPVLDGQGQLLGLVTPTQLGHLLQSMPLLKRYHVTRVMNTQVAYAPSTSSLLEIAQLLAKSRANSVLIVETAGGASMRSLEGQHLKPLGIMTERDIVRCRDLELNFSQVRAARMMNAPLLCLQPSDSLWVAQQQMQAHLVQRLAVVDDRGELQGVITQASLLQVLEPSDFATIVAALEHQVKAHQQKPQATFQPANSPVIQGVQKGLQREVPARQRIQTALQKWQAAVRAEARVKPKMSLSESEHRYQNLLEALPVGILRFDASGQCTYANRRWSEITGRPAPAAIGIGWLQAVHAAEQAAAVSDWQQWLRLVTPESPYQQTMRMIRPDGGLVWIEVLIQADPGTNPSLLGYVGTVTDITAHKCRETEQHQVLTESDAARAQLMTLLERMTDGWIALDADWRFTFVNAQAGRILQRDPADLIGKYVWSEFTNATDTAFYREYHRAISEQVSVEFEEFYPPLNAWFAVHAYPSDYGLVSYFEDITARKQAELKTKELATLLDITSDAIVVRDLDNRILYWNQGAERLYGWTATEAIWQDADHLLYASAPSPAQTLQAVQTVISQGEWWGEFQQVNRAGQEIKVKSRWTLARNETGHPHLILMINTDITEHKQLESQFLRAQRLESLGTLSSGMAHDLSNLLTPMLMAAQLLQQQCPKREDQELLKILEVNARRGRDLVQQVLTFAQGTVDKRLPIQLKHLLPEIKQICNQTFPKSIITSLDFPPDLAMVCGDVTQLHQAILNLCVNARDAMPAGGQLMLSAENFSADVAYARANLAGHAGPYVVITVADTGMGMTAELIDRIFDPFFTTKSTEQRSGLGLSVAQGIIHSHEGFITVKSKLEQGSQFRLYLPAITPAVAAAASGPKLPSGRNELILIVDDEANLLEIARLVLEGNNYRVLTASNGLDAIALFSQRQDKIDVVLMDMMMPDMGGQLALQTLRKINADVKVIVSSGLPSNQTSMLGNQAGIQARLPKPYTAQELLTTLDQVLTINHP